MFCFKTNKCFIFLHKFFNAVNTQTTKTNKQAEKSPAANKRFAVSTGVGSYEILSKFAKVGSHPNGSVPRTERQAAIR